MTCKQEGGPVSRSRSSDLEYSSACQGPLPLSRHLFDLVPCSSPARAVSPEAGRAIIDDDGTSEDAGECKWAGSFAGEKLFISPELQDRPVQVSTYEERGPVPRSIAFDSSSLPVVIEVDDDPTQTQDELQRVRQDVDELSLNVSALESNKSIVSAMTRESCVELAERLERMQNDLLCLAGDDASGKSHYTKSDAMRALAKAARNQARKSRHLSREVKALRKSNNKLASQLFEENESNRDLCCQNIELTKQLDHAETKAADLESTVTTLRTKLSQLETENVHRTRQLLQSWNISSSSKRPSSHNVQECDEIRMLRDKLARMHDSHRAKEERSADKIVILKDINHGLLEKIRYLEACLSEEDQESE